MYTTLLDPLVVHGRTGQFKTMEQISLVGCLLHTPLPVFSAPHTELELGLGLAQTFLRTQNI